MPVWPDIVVTNPDSDEVFLAVQVKAGGAGAHLAEWQIKDYMVHQSCPIGMLVTPEDSLFFSESLHGYEPETIQNIGECRTSDLLAAGSLADPYLVRRVEQWLDNLRVGGHRSWPSSVLEAMESYVRPAVMTGVKSNAFAMGGTVAMVPMILP